MAKNISLSTIKTFKNKFLRNNKNTASRNALIKNDLANVALNWENFSQINHNFSNLIKKELPATILGDQTIDSLKLEDAIRLIDERKAKMGLKKKKK